MINTTFKKKYHKLFVAVLFSVVLCVLAVLPIFHKKRAIEQPKQGLSAKFVEGEEGNGVNIPKGYFDNLSETWSNDTITAYIGDISPRTGPIPFDEENPDVELKYSNEVHILKEKTFNEMLATSENSYYKEISEGKEVPNDITAFYLEKFQEIFDSYPTYIAANYTGDRILTVLEEFDVDNDSINESIVTWSYPGANHPPHGFDILKNRERVFRFEKSGCSVTQTPSKNGFYVSIPDYDFGAKPPTAMCCPRGRTTVRFVFENGKYKPVWTQTLETVEIENE